MSEDQPVTLSLQPGLWPTPQAWRQWMLDVGLKREGGGALTGWSLLMDRVGNLTYFFY